MAASHYLAGLAPPSESSRLFAIMRPPLRARDIRMFADPNTESVIASAAPHATEAVRRPPLRVVHVVLAMEIGGLERVVMHLVRQGRGLLGQDITVICIERLGVLAKEL